VVKTFGTTLVFHKRQKTTLLGAESWLANRPYADFTENIPLESPLQLIKSLESLTKTSLARIPSNSSSKPDS